MIRLLYFIPTYFIFLLFRTLMILLGWILIPIMTLLKQYEEDISLVNGRPILNWKHKFMFPWSNYEDGILAGVEFLNMPDWFRIIYWSAIRNPANNLRFIPHISCELEPSGIRFIGPDYVKGLEGVQFPILDLRMYDSDEFRFITLTWQGIYSNLRIQFKMFGKIWRFWIGWKIYPHDSLGIAETDYRRYGAGFATQFKRIYPRQ